MKNATEDRFHRLLRRLGVPPALAGGEWQSLVALYAEPHRHYHNLHHVDAMLGKMDELCSGVADGDPALEMAVWYHDVIYDPRASDNERKSAVHFSNGAGIYMDPEIHDRVIRLIMATDYSRPRSGNEDEDFMRDLDLSILSASPDDYRRYREAIRMEYSHVPDDAFSAGRMAVMKRFLESPVFHSAAFVIHEDAARANIQSEIAEWGG